MAAARKPIISGNWKMHHNHFEAIQAVQKLHYRLETDDHEFVDVSVHPPFTDIRSIQTVIESDKMKILIGARTATGRTRAPSPAKSRRPCWRSST
jgi:triosephosphate isomerase